MFDIGWQELFLLAVLAIIVIGPKDLPGAIRTVTTWIRKARSMARDFQDGLDDVVREAELDSITAEANKMMDDGGLQSSEILADEFGMEDIENDWSETVDDLKVAIDPDKDGSRPSLKEKSQGGDFGDGHAQTAEHQVKSKRTKGS